ncbi:MAG TPA: trigger factor [Lautropia sp.]|nr:trigger factor [Lautropia sp.]
MASQLENTGSLERRLTLSVPTAEVTKKVQERYRSLARTVRMPGFRPGKVPLKLIEQSYGQQVQAEILGDAVSKAFTDAVDEHKLRVAGQPAIDAKEGSAEAADFTATFEVYPDVELAEPDAVQVERFTCEVGDAEVNKTIDVLRKQRTRWNEVQRAGQSGDRVTLDFVGTLDNVPFDGGSATDFAMVLGEGRMLPDFESGVAGKAAGETGSFDVSFPAEYSAKELAGKTARFEVTVKKVEEPELPALDSAFAEQMGVKEGDLEKFKADVRANLEREVSQRLKARTKTSVMDGIAGLARIDLPKSLVDQESQALAERMREDLKGRGVDVKDIPVPPDAFKDQAERRVRLGLIVAEIVRKHGLQAKPDQIRKQIEEFSQTYENPAEVVRWYFSDKSRLAEVEALVVEQNVVDWVLQKGQVTNKALTFDELMAGN